ncbi:OsmC family protein [Larkinella knui]|uniref:OsmC family peroxiredoxin n=1 Tax=Larkinella knui TaxID=2025310 RepID=A0A3P1CDZ3_9BACT|nr:OsmC family protein [Larkinella knui]RRB11563.1 OsmC family peroxiredoxin [Larkinella knui]
MPTIQTTYLGDLRTEAIHLQSGTRIITDAPTDNMGKGEAFSPTDLVAASLGSCIITTMGIVARREGIELINGELTITKVMSKDAPRRIVRIEIDIMMPPSEAYSDTFRAKMEHTAHTCPVALSLHPDLEQVIRFEWQESVQVGA